MTTDDGSSDTITFLGTAGARFMVSKQITASGGMWLDLSGTQILVDPGPGSLVQSTKRKLNAEKLSAIILSHRHLDHSTDVNVMIEAMTEGGFRKRGYLFAPADALENEPVVFSYVRKFLDGVEILQAGKTYSVGNVSFATPVRHILSVETYGMVFQTPSHKFSYIADTRYSEDLIQHYGGELLILNVVLLEPRPPVDHLSAPDVVRIVMQLKPKVAILNHFGMNMWRAHPWEVAEKLSQETGVKVIAAHDGMKFDLSQLDG